MAGLRLAVQTEEKRARLRLHIAPVVACTGASPARFHRPRYQASSANQSSIPLPWDRVTELPFQGLRVFLPRNYVPPEKFPALHDLLTNNGAEVCPILNASCNSNVDFHVMADNQTAKIKELLSKGCKVVGPECITRCARECRRLPDREYTCCFAMEGVGVLATGFSAEEKELIEWLVSSMCGNLQHQTSLNLDYVIAKNVLATKYKWAWSVLRKPIVSHEWLKHCAAQHRLVPYDPFRLPALAGLKICATGIAFAGREEIQMGARENGATYSADLTMDCTHLIAQISCHLICLDEDYFPVRTEDLPVAAGVKKFRQEVLEFQENQEQAAPASPTSDNEVSASLGHKPEAPVDRECGRTTIPGMPDYLYLSGCQFYFTGFEAVEMRRLVNLVLDGGGTRYIEFNNAVTHVIVGQPLERELIMLRQLAMWDAVYILQRSWLEECSQQKMEVSISDRHRVPQNMLLPGQWISPKKPLDRSAGDVSGSEIAKSPPPLQSEGSLKTLPSLGLESEKLSLSPSLQSDQSLKPLPSFATELEKPNFAPSFHNECSSKVLLSSGTESVKLNLLSFQTNEILKALPSVDVKSENQNFHPSSETEGSLKSLLNPGAESQHVSATTTNVPSGSEEVPVLAKRNVFGGSVFGFSDDISPDQRLAIAKQIVAGGGSLDQKSKRLDFLVVSHGIRPVALCSPNVRQISTHWISQCLQEATMLDPDSHVVFRPLQCQVPLSGFQDLRFCTSQYSERDRKLMRKLCHVLQAKFMANFNSKISYLLCKFQGGEKYESARRLGIPCVTENWLYACVEQNKVVPVDGFQPRELTAADKEHFKIYMTQHAITQYDSTPQPTGTLRTDVQPQGPVQSLLRSYQPTGVLRKKSNIRNKPASSHGKLSTDVQPSQRNSQVTSCTLSSQAAGTPLDPWDANAPWVAEVVNTKGAPGQPVAQKTADLRQDSKSELEGYIASRQENESIEMNVEDLHQRSNLGTGVSAVDTTLPQKGSGEGGISPPNVVDAIEGLLRQTSKVSIMIYNRFLVDMNPTLHAQPDADFLHVGSRSNKVEGEPKSPNLTVNPDSQLKFDESQIDSQVVAYDEDHSERQRIMEKVRTRSSTIALASSNSGSQLKSSDSAAWKGDQKLGRLFKAAEANK
ncbi:unnamed protein product [Sphagnum jensenii]|uniref:BRCT domain-containing protein n=1 Tax=Sphagnum jensenii TaxID=128206 RepID=A0ABP1AQ70_9BRYO